ncbi:hypothetical protein C2I36_15070 [Rhodobacteraceae bacterium WD3A24]|nr:hypothetical protein C2I36_15070 [Rhodobacteraceae bacterium WD3A24]
MGLFLSRFALLMSSTTAGGGDGGDGGGDTIGVQFDATKAGSGHTLSDDDRTVINTSGGTDYRWWVPATTRIPGNYPAPVYWEFEANPAGPSQFNGYHGVVSQAQLDDPAYTYDSGQNPVYAGSLGYRGSGDIWGIDGGRQATSPVSYGAGDIVMMAFNPVTGGLWVGLNGTWDKDPETSAPVEVSTAAGGDFWVIGQGRETDEGGTLRSLTSQFSYPVPGGFIALGESLGIADGVAAQVAEMWTELGGGADLSTARLEAWHQFGIVEPDSVASSDLWIEKDTS